MLGKFVVDNPKESRKYGKYIFILQVIIAGIGIIRMTFGLNFISKDLAFFLIFLGLSTLTIFIVGTYLYDYRTMLIRRSIIDHYRNSFLEKPDDIDTEINETLNNFTIGYVNEQVMLTFLAITSSYLISNDQVLMDLFGLTSFHFLQFTLFSVLGFLGYCVIILIFYRNYAYDPDSLLNENINNYKRVSATGRKGLQ